MVVLQYITDTQEGSQMLNTRLQRPTFIAEMGFVMSLLGFVSPPKEELQEYISGDLLLKSEITRAKADLWLSPDCRQATLCTNYSLVSLMTGHHHKQGLESSADVTTFFVSA
jgi:hypothetical protein